MSAAPRLTSVVFRLTRQKLHQLKLLARATRVRQSEYLREAIEDVLRKHEDAELSFPSSSGLGHRPAAELSAVQ